MLGKLTRWLRLLGYDVDYPPPNLSDEKLLELAQNTNRTLLTRDAMLVGKAHKLDIDAFLLKTTNIQEQLQEFAHRISPNKPLQPEGTRCSLCNTILIPITKNQIRSLQPKLQNVVHEQTLENHEEFWYCPHCYQAFWKGNQWSRISETLKKINAKNYAQGRNQG